MKPTKPMKEKVSLTLDANIVDRVKELADAQDRSFSSYVNIVLKRHLAVLDRKSNADP